MQYQYEYLKEEIKRCHLCKCWIETPFIKAYCNRTPFFFHKECYENFIIKLKRI